MDTRPFFFSRNETKLSEVVNSKETLASRRLFPNSKGIPPRNMGDMMGQLWGNDGKMMGNNGKFHGMWDMLGYTDGISV